MQIEQEAFFPADPEPVVCTCASCSAEAQEINF